MFILNSNSYSGACEKLSQISMFGSKPGLQRISKLLSLLGSPQEKTKCVLVGGTNGKGSTAIFLSSIISASGKKCALFLSPHIFSIRERIQVNGQNISEEKFAKLFFEVYSKCAEFEKEDAPTFFELITAMAFLHFAKEGCDFAVMEVGMGGRLDATNACEPILSIITSISLEHTAHLGNSIKKIAFEKAGAIRPGAPVICGAKGEAKEEIKKLANARGAKFIDAHDYFSPIQKNTEKGARKNFGEGAKFSLTFPQAGSSCILRLSTQGDFQVQNAAMAAIAADILQIPQAEILNAITSAKIPARWQQLSNPPKTIIDCAHNLGAFGQILPEIKKEFCAPQGARALIFGAMKDKEWKKELEIILPYFDFIILPRLPFRRAADAGEIKNFIIAKSNKKTRAQNICWADGKIKIIVCDANEALSSAKKSAGAKGKILCIGSIYLLQHILSEEKLGIIG
ncbi:hypothetical protein COU37_04850 [Candidatus Micrarchaeota archaeon CG10_big_fil_rev_8_21_14_0_10_45_29]|nr:MAG: hypothetical protein COU37_04850 [Candidatus Micrarchaeota archaeon CG10_big_fil_rev_8_21_14_0_10_45_29]